MIRIASQPKPTTPEWHEVFLRLLPAIRQHARISFRHLDPEGREEAVQEVVCNACCAVVRLAELGKLDLAYAGPLAGYGVAQVRDGRKVGCRLNICDVSSQYCQRRKNVVVERLDKFDEEENQWQEAVVVDTRSAPVPDIVAFRCDFPAWLDTLTRRNRKIALKLAIAESTGRVARMFRVSPGRVAQLRREFAGSWKKFTGETPPDAVAVTE